MNKHYQENIKKETTKKYSQATSCENAINTIYDDINR